MRKIWNVFLLLLTIFGLVLLISAFFLDNSSGKQVGDPESRTIARQVKAISDVTCANCEGVDKLACESAVLRTVLAPYIAARSKVIMEEYLATQK